MPGQPLTGAMNIAPAAFVAPLVTIRTAPNTLCTIRYITALGNLSVAGGLGPKTSGADGLVTWTWKIGAGTYPGIGEVIVTCGGFTISAPITIG